MYVYSYVKIHVPLHTRNPIAFAVLGVLKTGAKVYAQTKSKRQMKNIKKRNINAWLFDSHLLITSGGIVN